MTNSCQYEHTQVATFGRTSMKTKKVTRPFATDNMDALLSMMEVSAPCLKMKLLQSIATVTHQVSTCIFRWYFQSELITNDILEPKTCAWLFDGDSDRWEYGRVGVKDGFEIGMEYSMDEYPVYVENDDLSAIHAYDGNSIINMGHFK